jgi:putative transcriptional regulator
MLIPSDVHDKLVNAFEESTRDVVMRHWNGGNREKLKLLRRALGMTQREFADAFGLPYPTVRNWEQPDRGEPSEMSSLFIDMIIEDPNAMKGLVDKVKKRRATVDA